MPGQDGAQTRRGYLFHDVADIYDQARPKYPEQLFTDLVHWIPITASSRILEIGCGTGIATQSLAAWGCPVAALDPGEEMVAVARRRLQHAHHVEFHVSTFEEYCSRAEGQFTAVIAATSYHWLDPDMRERAVWNLLHPSGAIAIFRHWGRVGGDVEFYTGVQEIYRSLAPELLEEAIRAAAGDPSAVSFGHVVPLTDEAIAAHTDRLEHAELWKEMEYVTYPWEQVYTGEEYVNLLSTYSDHLLLAPDVRERLFAAIRTFIDTSRSGHVRKAYATALRRARKRFPTG